MVKVTLFEVESAAIVTDTCRHCIHRERHQCGGSIVQYCGLRKSTRTHNGKLKIKVTDTACSAFEKESTKWVNNDAIDEKRRNNARIIRELEKEQIRLLTHCYVKNHQ